MTDENCSHDKQCTVISFIAQVPKMMKQNESKDHKNPVDTSLESESQIVRDMKYSLPSPPQKEGGHEQSKKQGRAVKGNTFSEEHIGRLKHELNGTIKSLAREQIPTLKDTIPIGGGGTPTAGLFTSLTKNSSKRVRGFPEGSPLVKYTTPAPFVTKEAPTPSDTSLTIAKGAVASVLSKKRGRPRSNPSSMSASLTKEATNHAIVTHTVDFFCSEEQNDNCFSMPSAPTVISYTWLS